MATEVNANPTKELFISIVILQASEMSDKEIVIGYNE